MKTEYLITEEPRMKPVHPGEILREDVLPALGINISEAARQLGVSRQTLHRILAETHAITPEMALRLGKFCGNGPGLWLRMQQRYDLWLAEKRLRHLIKKIPSHTRTLHQTSSQARNATQIPI
jgi:addiction module HigA family antidote